MSEAYTHQKAAEALLKEKGVRELHDPHGMIGKMCGCGTCFCCAAWARVQQYWNDNRTPKQKFKAQNYGHI